MILFGKSLAGAGYVVLNVIRVMNIIALLSVVAASSVMLVKTFIVSKFFFFDACEHVIRIVISGTCWRQEPDRSLANPVLGFLILTELPLFKGFFSRNWPLFSARSSFIMLGVAMICLGNSILGNLNKEATSQKSLGLPFWRIVIASGIVVLVMGSVNILAVSVTNTIATSRILIYDAAELCVQRQQGAPDSSPSTLSRSGGFTQGRRGSLDAPVAQTQEPLPIFLPRRQTRLSPIVFFSFQHQP